MGGAAHPIGEDAHSVGRPAVTRRPAKCRLGSNPGLSTNQLTRNASESGVAAKARQQPGGTRTGGHSYRWQSGLKLHNNWPDPGNRKAP